MRLTTTNPSSRASVAMPSLLFSRSTRQAVITTPSSSDQICWCPLLRDRRETTMKRRQFLKLSAGVAVAALSAPARARENVKEIRIGYQKTGVLVITRQQ